MRPFNSSIMHSRFRRPGSRAIWPTSVPDSTGELARDATWRRCSPRSPHQRDRLQFEHVGKIDLRETLLLMQPKQYDPLRARGAASLGTMINIVAEQARTFNNLRNQTAFQIERHFRFHAHG